MDTNMKELNMDEMEMANGGWSWASAACGGVFGGLVGTGLGMAITGLAVASGPVGWVMLAGAAAGAATVGGCTGALK